MSVHIEAKPVKLPIKFYYRDPSEQNILRKLFRESCLL